MRLRKMLAMLLACAMLFGMMPTFAFAAGETALVEGETYYFDLTSLISRGATPSEAVIGTGDNAVSASVGTRLPDKTYTHVPFTYLGTKVSYNMTEVSNTPSQSNSQDDFRSFFIANYDVVETVSWNELHANNLILGSALGANFTVMAPTIEDYSVNKSHWTHAGLVVPNYIENSMSGGNATSYVWGQQGNGNYANTYHFAQERITEIAADSQFGLFRPVIQTAAIADDTYKVMTLDLNGNSIGSETALKVVYVGDNYTAISTVDPVGKTFASWNTAADGGGTTYAAGESVPSTVATLYAQYTDGTVSQQTYLEDGGEYYFDLSEILELPSGFRVITKEDTDSAQQAHDIFLPDYSLNFTPFYYFAPEQSYHYESYTDDEGGTKTEGQRDLFVSKYALVNNVSWNSLDDANLVYGTPFEENLIMRLASGGASGGDAASEWDMLVVPSSLNPLSLYFDTITQDINNRETKSSVTVRAGGNDIAARSSIEKDATATDSAWRPVLEIDRTKVYGYDEFKSFTLNLKGATFASGDDKNPTSIKVAYSGDTYTVPNGDGMARPVGNTGTFFGISAHQNGEAKIYLPGEEMPVTPNGVYYMIWENVITISFDVSPSTDAPPVDQYLSEGKDIYLSDPTASNSGYVFVGWSDGTNTYNSNIPYTAGSENVTLTAVWADRSNMHTLTVGTDARQYAAGSEVLFGTSRVTITEGKSFLNWTSTDTINFADGYDAYDRETVIIMPNSDLTISHTEGDSLVITYNVGQGADLTKSYAAGSRVELSAAESVSGSGVDRDYFKEWTWGSGAEPTFAKGTDKYSQKVYFAMPDSAFTMTATHDTSYALTITKGTGRSFAPEGVPVTIVADNAATGTTFTGWTGLDSVTFADGMDETMATTTFTMPAEALTITATYSDPPPTVTSVTITPTTATVAQGATEDFDAEVVGTNNPAVTVTWSTNSTNSGTTIDADGLLTVAADESATVLTVTATSTQDSSKSGAATVTVEKMPIVNSVSITPTVAKAQVGTTVGFTAEVQGENNPDISVDWSLSGTSNAATTLDTDGTLTIAADESATELTITATSNGDSTKSASATVLVSADVVEITSITLTPMAASVIKGQTEQFSVVVEGIESADKSVTWSLDGTTNSGTTLVDGLLTVAADESATEVTVKATSVGDTTMVAAATVTVTDPPSPTVTSVTVTPTSPSVYKGETETFTAAVVGDNDPETTVTWEVTGENSADTTMVDGLLTVAADETATTLTVIATSTVDTSKSGSATVTVADPPVTYAVTVNLNGGNGSPSGQDNYEEFETVTINAGSRSGYTFNSWIVEGDNVTLDNSSAATTTFTMPAEAVTVSANWTAISSGGTERPDREPTSGTSGATGTDKTDEDSGTGINVEGDFSGNMEVAVIDASAALYSEMTDALGSGIIKLGYNTGFKVLGAFEIEIEQVGGNIKLTFPVGDMYNGKRFFIAHKMGDGSVEVYTGIVKEGLAVITVDELSPFVVAIEDEAGLPFADLTSSAWYFDAVAYVYTNGIMNGISEEIFAPDGKATRATIWTVLARMDGIDTAGGDAWYSVAQDWATDNGVSDGTSPNGDITRQEFVTMLYRYHGEPTVDGMLDYPDDGDVADWAYEAFIWAVDSNVISGNTLGKLNPQGAATRAELATMLMRYMMK